MKLFPFGFSIPVSYTHLAVYYLDKYKTVFSIHSCGDYFYQSDGNILCIEEAFFNRQEWYCA